MKKSLFRFKDRFELLGCYTFCFIINILFDYAKFLKIDSHLIQTFVKQFYDYQALIIFLLTFIVVIFHYQMLQNKKMEIYCKIVAGDTMHSLVIRYVFENFVILGIAFVIAIIVNIILGIKLVNSLYLFFVLTIYILISSRMVKNVESV